VSDKSVLSSKLVKESNALSYTFLLDYNERKQGDLALAHDNLSADDRCLQVAPTLVTVVQEDGYDVYAEANLLLSFRESVLFDVLRVFANPRRVCDVNAEIAQLTARRQSEGTGLSPNAETRPDGLSHIRQMISLLERAKILVESGSSESVSRNAGAHAGDGVLRTNFALAESILSATGSILMDLRSGSDLGADGIASVTMQARLRACAMALDAIRVELNGLRPQYLESQLGELGIADDSSGLRLHIGCGPYILPSWINIDIKSPQLQLDIRRGLPFADGIAHYVFLSHTLEHFRYPNEALSIAREIRRVLAPGGVLRVIVPDMAQWINAYATNDREFFECLQETWTWWPKSLTRLERLLWYGGASSNHEADGHKFGYDYETLEKLLLTAGFRTVERSEYMASKHEPLRVDRFSVVAGAQHGSLHYSLFVDATA
jgi:predicted SAM-dependent methyltransferase